VYSVFQDTVDIDFQWRLPAGERHEINWGVGYRAIFDNYDPRFVVTIRPGKRYSPLFSAFIQDDITLIDDKLHFIFGTKVEHNSFTGLEVQPNARVLWTPKPNHTVWGGVSRAVRTPSRGEDGLELNARALPPGTLGAGTPAALARITGDKDFKSEQLCAFELGYRSNPIRCFSFDIATFYNLYDDLRTSEAQNPVPEAVPGPPHLLLEQRLGNNMKGYSFGGELVANYQPFSWWRLTAQYSYVKLHFDLDDSTDFDAQREDRSSPEHTVSLRTNFELPHNVEVGAGIRYVSDIAYTDTPAYLAGDATIIWHATKNLSLSLTGQNLFDNRHPEFAPAFVRTPRSEVEHSVYFKLTFKF
jgi:iron complex outermembrane receptor protein